jgi:hypothetical protein
MLKSGIEVSDNRLDRLITFDPRSRSYSIRDVQNRKTLRSYTWRCNDWFDQGYDGACVAFSLGHELASRPAETKNIHTKWLREKVYWEAQKIDIWPGGSYPGADPFYEGTSLIAGVKILHKKEFFKEYRWAFDFHDLLVGLGRNGPAVLGMNWYSDMLNTDSEGFVRPTGFVVGGHAVLARAINVREKYVTIRNSWGKSWGVKGDCYIRFDDLERLLNEQGEAVFLLGRTAKYHKANIDS